MLDFNLFDWFCYFGSLHLSCLNQTIMLQIFRIGFKSGKLNRKEPLRKVAESRKV